MFHLNYSKAALVATRLAILLVCLSTAWHSAIVVGQTESTDELKKRVGVLLEQLRYTEAVPLLEKLAAAEPDDSETHYYLAASLLGLVANTKDEAEKKQLRLRARAEFLKAKELGNTAPNLNAMIQMLPADGSGSSSAFSARAEADALMTEGEALFSRGQLDDAFKAYQKALALDPKLYHAALFSGDVKLHTGDYAQAEVWYKRAIEIDPNKETAYRYSATPLMKQEKFNEARDRYIEAYITEPYNSFTAGGLKQWAQATNRQLAHPKIEVPTSVKFDEKGEVKIDLDASVLLGGKDDGSFSWIAYGTTRSSWYKEKFKTTFPTETTYRHSLAEEADALRSVILLATGDKKTKSLSPSLKKLKKLNDEGLLEAYILLGRADRDIAKDHPAYLRDNRDKLRRYALDYVTRGGGFE